MTSPLDDWLDAVTSGESTMSQRGTRWVEAQGGLGSIVERARARGVHLLQLTDDEGKVLIAASLNAFTVLC